MGPKGPNDPCSRRRRSQESQTRLASCDPPSPVREGEEWGKSRQRSEGQVHDSAKGRIIMQEHAERPCGLSILQARNPERKQKMLLGPKSAPRSPKFSSSSLRQCQVQFLDAEATSKGLPSEWFPSKSHELPRSSSMNFSSPGAGF